MHRSAVQTYPFGVATRVEPGKYRFSFRGRETPGQSVDVKLVDGTRRVRPGAPIPPSESRREHGVVLGVDAAPTAEPVLRFNLPRCGRGTFDLAAAHLRALPEATLSRIREADAILLGAMGLPDVRRPNGVELTPQIDLREKLDLYNGVRPIRLYHASHSPLYGYGTVGSGRPIDFVIVRENCEGLFSERLAPRPSGRDFETDTMRITRRGAGFGCPRCLCRLRIVACPPRPSLPCR